MADEYTSQEGMIDMRNLTGVELLQKVAFMLEESGDRHAFLDIMIKDQAGDPQVIRMFLCKENVDVGETMH